ncbi:MAG: efflux RND transporter periplasmic adaptor subunit [Myxococcales bacterium]
MTEKSSSAAYYAVGVALAALATGGVAALAWSRGASVHAEALAREKALSLGPHVRVARAGRSGSSREVSVQGEAQPFASVTLYAKVSGYLRSIQVDKGDRVKRGELLAVIEAPEIDQQLLAASADARNKRVNAARAKALVGPGVVSAQDYDSAVAGAEVAEATEKAAHQERAYEVLRAPFDGTVTARYADPGALLQAATAAQTSALPVVTIAQIERLRIYAYLDQRDAAFVREGNAAVITVPERPGQPIRAAVTRLSRELDSKTRTMLVEIDLDNAQGLIVAGSFVQVAIELPVPSLVEVPAAALVLRGGSPFVGVVGEDDRVRFRPVTLAGDDGIRARVATGLEGNERVALDLGDDVEEGGLIQPVGEEGPHVPAQH